jgi:hypothetical protein
MRVRDHRYQPRLESLERRDLMASHLQASLAAGSLFVQDDQPGDFIGVSQAAGRISVLVNGSAAPVLSNGAWAADVSAGDVQKVVVTSTGGGAVVDLNLSGSAQVTRDALVNVYGGHNTVIGGAGKNVLYGYGGSNTLTGGSGTNYILDGSALSHPDSLVGGDGMNWYYHPITKGQPFAGGEHIADIQQGQSPLCQTLAALAEAVGQGYDFSHDITYLGANEYRVQLHDGSGAQTVYFDGYYSDNDPAVVAGSADFWPVLMARARLQELGINPYQHYSPCQWDQLESQTDNRLLSVSDALTAFTGLPTGYNDLGSVSPQDLHNALARGDLLIVSGTAPSGAVSPDGIIGHHAYSVLNIYQEDGMWKVRLFNPWGIDSVGGRTIDALQDGAPARNDGFITLSWAQFTNPANFQGYTQASTYWMQVL